MAARPLVTVGVSLVLQQLAQDVFGAQGDPVTAPSWLGGRISVDSSFDLEPDGAGTAMRWRAEVDAAGIFSGLGSQALGPVATQQAERALDRLEKGLKARAR